MFIVLSQNSFSAFPTNQQKSTVLSMDFGWKQNGEKESNKTSIHKQLMRRISNEIERFTITYGQPQIIFVEDNEFRLNTERLHFQSIEEIICIM